MSDLNTDSESVKSEEIYVIRWPFKLIELNQFNFLRSDSPIGASPAWDCGWHQEQSEYENICWHDADGWMTIKVVSRHKPTPRHMERCFIYKRLYDPFGQPFNKSSFHCITQGRLSSYLKGHVVSHSELCGDIADRYAEIERFVVPHKSLQYASQPLNQASA